MAGGPDTTHSGLSPRVRGNLVANGELEHVPGSIPACAGEPSPYSRRHRWQRVYPRVCGGTSVLIPPTRQVLGLSPRVRGNHQQFGNDLEDYRSIPACAGEPPAEENE